MVIDSRCRIIDGRYTMYRRRICKKCNSRFSTYELEMNFINGLLKTFNAVNAANQTSKKGEIV